MNNPSVALWVQDPGRRRTLGSVLDAGEMIAGMHLKGTRGPVGRSLGAGWAHKGPVGHFLDARGHWDVTWVMGAGEGARRPLP